MEQAIGKLEKPQHDLFMIKEASKKTYIGRAKLLFWITVCFPDDKKYIIYIGSGYPWVKTPEGKWQMDFSIPHGKKTHAFTDQLIGFSRDGEVHHTPLFLHKILRAPDMSIETLDQIPLTAAENDETDDKPQYHRLAYYIFKRDEKRNSLELYPGPNGHHYRLPLVDEDEE